MNTQVSQPSKFQAEFDKLDHYHQDIGNNMLRGYVDRKQVLELIAKYIYNKEIEYKSTVTSGQALVMSLIFFVLGLGWGFLLTVDYFNLL